jgi:hypothetical protein
LAAVFCLSSTLHAQQPGDVARQNSGFFFNFESVIVQPQFSSDPAFYITDSAISTGDNYQEVPFDWNFSYSPRFEGGFVDDQGVGFRGRYWYFYDTTSILSPVDPNDISGGFGEDSTEIGVTDANQAFFTRGLQMHVLDAEAALLQGNWTFSGGYRYTRMNQSYNGIEIGAGPEQFISESFFDGGGPTASVGFLQPMRWGLSAFANARGSLLFGNSWWFAVDPDDDDRFERSNPHDSITVGELQTGIDWRTVLPAGQVVFVRAAMEGQMWFSAGTGSPTINAPYDELNYQNAHAQDANLGFFGGTIATGLIY